jgi:hypothetical protein
VAGAQALNCSQAAAERRLSPELCGHSFSASSISAINQRLDQALAQFAGRALAKAFPYLILDARYERVREAGVIASPPPTDKEAQSEEARRQSSLINENHTSAAQSQRPVFR